MAPIARDQKAMIRNLPFVLTSRLFFTKDSFENMVPVIITTRSEINWKAVT
jgi:hypothetical protein